MPQNSSHPFILKLISFYDVKMKSLLYLSYMMRAKTKKTGLTSRCLNVNIILLSQNSARFKIVFPT